MPLPFYRRGYKPDNKAWNQEQNICIDNFGGGLNNSDQDHNIADNECSDTENMAFTSPTSMSKRYGFGTMHYTPYFETNPSITWIDEYKPYESSPQMVVANDEKLFINDELICDVAGRVRGTTFFGKYYFVDGERYRVWDGENVLDILSPPIATYLGNKDTRSNGEYLYPDLPTGYIKLDAIPESLEVGMPVYSLNFYDSTNRVYVSTKFGEVGAINEELCAIRWDKPQIHTGDPSYGLQINSPVFFYIPKEVEYTTGNVVVNETTKWYEPCLNELADSFKSGHYFPDAPKIITSHKNRIVVAGDSKQTNGVFMSDISNPLYFPSASSIAVDPTGDSIVDLVVFDGSLIIGRHLDLYVLYGSSPDPTNSNAFYIKKMDSTTGFMSDRCGALMNNFYIYLGFDGKFYKLNTPTTFVEYLMTRPLSNKLDIYESPISEARITGFQVSATTHDDEVLFNLPNHKVIVYNYTNMAYTYYDGWQSTFLYNDGTILYSGNSQGYLLQYKDSMSPPYNNYVDMMTIPIRSKLCTKRFDFGSPTHFKYFKNLLITTRIKLGMRSKIDVKYEIDGVVHNNSNGMVIDVNSDSPIFGYSEWDESVYDSPNNNYEDYSYYYNLYKSRWINLDSKGRSIKFIFTSDPSTVSYDGTQSIDQPMQIFDINLNFTTRDVR